MVRYGVGIVAKLTNDTKSNLARTTIKVKKTKTTFSILHKIESFFVGLLFVRIYPVWLFSFNFNFFYRHFTYIPREQRPCLDKTYSKFNKFLELYKKEERSISYLDS